MGYCLKLKAGLGQKNSKIRVVTNCLGSVLKKIISLND